MIGKVAEELNVDHSRARNLKVIGEVAEELIVDHGTAHK